MKLNLSGIEDMSIVTWAINNNLLVRMETTGDECFLWLKEGIIQSDKTHSCPYCGEQFVSIVDRQDHVFKIHELPDNKR